MSGWVTAFQSAWTSADMWTEATMAAPVIGAVVIFAFGYRIIRRLVGGISKGKAKI